MCIRDRYYDWAFGHRDYEEEVRVFLSAFLFCGYEEVRDLISSFLFGDYDEEVRVFLSAFLFCDDEEKRVFMSTFPRLRGGGVCFRLCFSFLRRRGETCFHFDCSFLRTGGGGARFDPP